MNTRERGNRWEEQAAQYLESVRGWRVLARQVRFREGEIDLIMETPEKELRFVEVKGRSNEKFGGVVEAVTTHKFLRLRRAVYRWKMANFERRSGLFYFVGILENSDGAFTIEEHFIE